MTSAKLRALFSSGLTYDEIAVINERSEGWKPSRAAVMRKYEALGMPPRRASHRDLIPWRISAEHSDSVVRHMLQAESRSRQHKPLSDTDRKLVQRLHELLFGRGTLMVVTYHPEIGFAFVLREDSDEDIVRPGAAAIAVQRIADAMQTVGDDELAALAFKGGVRAETLENADRNRAADLLRRMQAGEEVVVAADANASEARPDADAQPRRRAAR